MIIFQFGIPRFRFKPWIRNHRERSNNPKRNSVRTLDINTFTMRFSTSSILLFASSLLGVTSAHNIQLAAHGRECFHENLHRDDKMTVTFQVGDREFGGAGNLHVDFWVCFGNRKWENARINANICIDYDPSRNIRDSPAISLEWRSLLRSST